MRKLEHASFVLIVSLVCTLAAHAQDSVDAIFLPANGSGGTIMDLATGSKSKFIESDGRPDDCPELFYWGNKYTVYNCADDAAFELVPPVYPAQFPPGALLLKPLPAPGPGTDDPGPNKSKREDKSGDVQ